MDIADLASGVRWEPAIRKAIRESDFFLVLLSTHSTAKRGELQTEMQEALSVLAEMPPNEIFLIPARLDDCSVPTTLSNIHWVDLFTKSGWQLLIRSLKHRTEQKKPVEKLKRSIKRVEKAKASRPHMFIAMPFSPAMEDIYTYGISRAVDANGYSCERIDQGSFTGSIVDEIKEKIETAVAVIADLTGSNPNVHLELGYAWGKQIPTVLLTQKAKAVCFDVRDQRCIEYQNIKTLEELLTKELAALKSKGRI